MTLPRIRLTLTPADVVMFRDSRPLEQTITGTRCEFPTPRTIAGALRTWLLRGLGADMEQFSNWIRKSAHDDVASAFAKAAGNDPEATGIPPKAAWVVHARFLGPLLMQHQLHQFASPLNYVLPEGGDSLEPLAPHPGALPGWSEPTKRNAGDTSSDTGSTTGLRPLRMPTPGPYSKVEGGWIGQSVLSASVLRGLSSIFRRNVDGTDAFTRDEYRLGIEINSDRSASRTGRLYAQSFWRLDNSKAKATRFYVEIEAPPPSGGEPPEEQVKALIGRQPWLPLGGEGKIARIDCTDKPGGLTDTLSPAEPWPARSFFTYLATPGLFEEGAWLPHKLSERFELVGALTGPPRVVSGWDIARKLPGKSRHAVQAGAVYFWRLRDPNHPGDDPHLTCISDNEADAREGWGLCLRGKWNG